MVNQRNRYPARRRFLKQSAALSARAALPAAVVLAGAAAANAKPAPESASHGGASTAERADAVVRGRDPAGSKK